MKSTEQGTVIARMRSAVNTKAPRSTATISGLLSA